jgi:hypothetical protein
MNPTVNERELKELLQKLDSSINVHVTAAIIAKCLDVAKGFYAKLSSVHSDSPLVIRRKHLLRAVHILVQELLVHLRLAPRRHNEQERKRCRGRPSLAYQRPRRTLVSLSECND